MRRPFAKFFVDNMTLTQPALVHILNQQEEKVAVLQHLAIVHLSTEAVKSLFRFAQPVWNEVLRMPSHFDDHASVPKKIFLLEHVPKDQTEMRELRNAVEATGEGRGRTARAPSSSRQNGQRDIEVLKVVDGRA